MKPGRIVAPPRSMTVALAGMARPAPAAVIVSPSMMTTAFVTGAEPVPSIMCAALMATVCARSVVARRRAIASGRMPLMLLRRPPWAHVHRLRADDAIVLSLLETMRDPSCHSADGEGRCEERNLEPEAVGQECGVELDVGLQPASRLVLLEEPDRRRFDCLRQLVEPHVAAAREHPFRRGCQHIRARIAHLVHAMPEAHQLLSRFD